MAKATLVIIFIFLHLVKGISQELPYTENIDWEHERHKWSASWITHPNESVFEYGVFLFRNQLELKYQPEIFKIYISADNRYRLYVNGRYITLGPAKGSLMYWRYETIDISPYLKKGQNIIAAEVINFGEYRPAAQFSHQTAFIFQSDTLSNLFNTGTASWKVIKDQSYLPREVTREMTMGKYYVAGPCDSIVAEKHLWGWKDEQFRMQDWQTPKIIQRGVGRGYMHGTPWMLVPRNIPLMEEKIKRFTFIARNSNLEVSNDFLLGESSTYIPENTYAKILLDQLHLTTAYPVLKSSGGYGGKIKITYSEALYDANGKKGNRNVIEGKEIMGYSDVIMFNGGENRVFKTTWNRTYRYVELEIQTGASPLYLHDFYGVYIAYPFKQEAEFNANDEFLNQIWNIGWRTARLCANETYMDCPYWEQLQYLGDTRIQSLVSLYVAGDDRLMKNAIIQADQSRIPEGLTLSRGPSYIPQVIPAFSLYWIAMVHDYFMYRRDDAFIKDRLLGIQAVLGWFEKRIDKNGMLGGLDWFNFADWTEGFAVGSPPGVDTGNSALVTLNYIYALKRAAELHDYYGYHLEAKRYNEQAKKLSESVYDLCYNKNKGIFADTPLQNSYSQHTNIFAILTDIIPADEQSRIMSRITDDATLIQTTIYYKFYLFEALYKTGMADLYLSMLQPWEKMLDEGLTTFAEGDYKDRSDCHAWSASPLYHFLSLTAGIRPDAPGFKKIRIQPYFGHLTTLKSAIPHPDGTIKIDLIKEGNGVFGNIEVPENTESVFTWQNKEIKLKPGNQKIKMNIK